MVGVPRSKGCRVCVSRRVRCDLNKPICNNCKRGNRDCHFADGLKFQDEGAKLRKRYAKKSKPQEQGSFAASSSSESPSSSQYLSSTHTSRTSTPIYGTTVPNRNAFFGLLESNKHPRYEGNEQNRYDDTVFLYPEMRNKILPLEDRFESLPITSILLSPGLAQEQLLGLFYASLSPSNQAVQVPMPLRSHGPWLARLPPLTGRNYLLDSAIRAVVLAHMGRLHGSDVFLNESRPYYGKAIRLLNAALSDSEEGMASETLSATILLSFYEMFASNSNDSWIQHAGGAGALMRIRGAQQHRYGFDREIFLACRHTIIIESMHRGEPCFLNEPDWIQLARDAFNDMIERVPEGDSLELFYLAENFYEEMLTIPALLHASRNFQVAHAMEIEAFPTTNQFRKELVRRTLTVRANLKSFFAKFDGCTMKLGCHYNSYASDDPVVSSYYNFPNVFIASTCTGYWTILVILNFVLIELERAEAPENARLYKAENYDCAMEICRSTPYMLTSSFLGPFFNIFGLRMCLVAFENNAEREWVIKKLFEIGETHMAMAKHIPGHAPGETMPKVRQSLTQPAQIEEVDEYHSFSSEIQNISKQEMTGYCAGG